jgi:hypothetical protein
LQYLKKTEVEGYAREKNFRNTGQHSVAHSGRGLSVDDRTMAQKLPREFYNQGIAMITHINKILK